MGAETTRGGITEPAPEFVGLSSPVGLEGGAETVSAATGLSDTPLGWAHSSLAHASVARPWHRATNRAALAALTGKFLPPRRHTPAGARRSRRRAPRLLYWATMLRSLSSRSLLNLFAGDAADPAGPCTLGSCTLGASTACRARGAALIAIGFGISGCHLDSNFSDLGGKLLNPDVAGLDVPGQRLVSGVHFDLSTQADAAGGRYAVARNENSELTIINFGANTHCRAGTVARYGNAVSASGQSSLLPVLLADADGNTELGFSDFDCNRTSFQVPAGGLPIDVIDHLDWGSGTALLIDTPDSGLALVDPWSEDVRQVAASVRPSDPVSAFDHYLWVDGGVIVVSDATLTRVAQVGSNVGELTLSPDDGQLAYVQATSADNSTGGDLFVVDATDTHVPQQIASDACALRYLTLGERRLLSFLSPCSARTLVLFDRADSSTRVLAEQLASPPLIHGSGGSAFLTYVTAEASGSPIGTLWVWRGKDDPIAVAENARINPSAVTPDGGLLSVLDWSSTGGRLVEWKGDTLTDVAVDRVVELESVGRLDNNDLTLLGNYDGTTGDLLRLHSDLTTEVLAQGVPTRSANDDAFLANFDGQAGELRLLNRSDGSSQVLGTGVARGSFKFAQQWSGVMMLTERDTVANTSTLQVHMLDTGNDYVLHDGVTEAREVAYPSSGLLYNVVSGDDAGVWFSKTL